jgi:hypothetical protein
MSANPVSFSHCLFGQLDKLRWSHTVLGKFFNRKVYAFQICFTSQFRKYLAVMTVHKIVNPIVPK